MNGSLEITHTLSTTDVDMYADWRMSHVFLLMQEAGTAHCEQNGLGIREMRSQNLAWVLSRAQVHLDRLPKLGETVLVKTWPKPPQHFFFPRYYAFSIGTQRIGQASSLYVQLDLDTRRMTKPWLGGNAQLNCETEPAFSLPGGLPRLAGCTETIHRIAQYSDLDVNGHVNNTRYLDWFCDCFDADRHRSWQLRGALVHYNREIVLQEHVALQRQTEGTVSLVRGENENGTFFSICGEWFPR